MSRGLVDPKDNPVLRCHVLSFVHPAKTGEAPLLGRYPPINQRPSLSLVEGLGMTPV